MNSVLTMLAALADHGPMVLLGATVVLLCGVLAMLVHRSPTQRRWLGLATALGVGLYLLVASLPLPRLALRAVGDAPVAAVARAPALDAETRAAQLQAALVALTTQPVDSVGAVAMPSAVLPEPSGVTPAPQPVVPGPSWPWGLVLAAAYACGVLVMLVRTLVGHLRLRALLAHCEPVPLAQRAGIAWPRGTRVLSTPHAVRPFCAGVWRPVVVVPRALLAPGHADAAAAVLRHEAAHLAAGDARALTLLAWLAVPLFCHPLFWWLSREVRFCSELLADEAAARAGGRQRYARALIDLAERCDQPVAAVGTVAVFHRPSEFYRRIQMLLQRQGPLSTSSSRLRRAAQSSVMLCLVGASASLFGVPALAQDPVPTLRQQNTELRQTIELLRSELADLRAQIGTLRETPPPGGVGSMEDHAKDQFRGAVRRVVEGRGQVAVDLPPPQDATAGLPNLPQGPGVPVLSRVPLLNNLFRAPTDGPATEPAPVPTRPYTIQKGDSLERIARRELGGGSRLEQIKALNPELDMVHLRIGQVLQLPTVDVGPTDPAVLPGSGGDGLATPEPLPTANLPTNLGGGLAPAPAPTPLPPTTPSSVAALADLTSRYLDLQGELEVQRIAVDETKALAQAGQMPQREAARAAVQLRTLERKLAIASRLIDGEIAASEAELQWLQARRGESSPTDTLQLEMQMGRARSRLEALRSVR